MSQALVYLTLNITSGGFTLSSENGISATNLSRRDSETWVPWIIKNTKTDRFSQYHVNYKCQRVDGTASVDCHMRLPGSIWKIFPPFYFGKNNRKLRIKDSTINAVFTLKILKLCYKWKNWKEKTFMDHMSSKTYC